MERIEYIVEYGYEVNYVLYFPMGLHDDTWTIKYSDF